MAVALTGCKDGQGAAKVQPSDQPSQPSQTGASGAPGSPGAPGAGQPTSNGKTNLTVTMRASEKAKASTWTLTCDPVSGTLAHAKDACAALDKIAAAKGDPFAPTPEGQMCTQIYGGPQVATVKGTWNGKKIDATFNRKNGCELKRWNDLSVLLGPAPSGH